VLLTTLSISIAKGVWKNAIKSEKKAFSESTESIGIGFHKEYEPMDFLESPSTSLITVVPAKNTALTKTVPSSSKTGTNIPASSVAPKASTTTAREEVGVAIAPLSFGPATKLTVGVSQTARAQSVGIDAGSKIRQQQRQEEFLSEYNNLLRSQIQVVIQILT